MEPTKRRKLEAAGYKVTTVAEFLQLTPEEESIIEIRLSLRKLLKQKLSEDINSSQLQMANPSNSIELLIKSLLSLGATREDIAAAVAGK